MRRKRDGYFMMEEPLVLETVGSCCGEPGKYPVWVLLRKRACRMQRSFGAVEPVPVFAARIQPGVRFDQIACEIPSVKPFLEERIVAMGAAPRFFGLSKQFVYLRVCFQDLTLSCGRRS